MAQVGMPSYRCRIAWRMKELINSFATGRPLARWVVPRCARFQVLVGAPAHCGETDVILPVNISPAACKLHRQLTLCEPVSPDSSLTPHAGSRMSHSHGHSGTQPRLQLSKLSKVRTRRRAVCCIASQGYLKGIGNRDRRDSRARA